MPRKIMLRMYAGVTKKGKNTKVSTVLARNRIEAKRKMRKKHGSGAKVVSFGEDIYSRRGARWSRNGRRIR